MAQNTFPFFFWSQLENKNHKYNNYYPIIQDWLFKKNKNLIPKWMRGELTYEQVCKYLANDNNLNYGIVRSSLEESCKNMAFGSTKIIELTQNIKKQKIKVVIATDNMDTFRKFTIPSLSLNNIFDDFLISCELGILKYDTMNNQIPFFDSYLKKNNLSYGDALLLDDSKDSSGVYHKLGFEIKLVKNSTDLLNYLRIINNSIL